MLRSEDNRLLLVALTRLRLVESPGTLRELLSLSPLCTIFFESKPSHHRCICHAGARKVKWNGKERQTSCCTC